MFDLDCVERLITKIVAGWSDSSESIARHALQASRSVLLLSSRRLKLNVIQMMLARSRACDAQEEEQFWLENAQHEPRWQLCVRSQIGRGLSE